MAELVICGLDDLAGVVAERAPSHVISMLGDKDFPALAGTEHLKLRFHDIDQPQEGLLTPGEAAVRDLLDFAAGSLLRTCLSANSLLNRENTGNFCRFDLKSAEFGHLRR